MWVGPAWAFPGVSHYGVSGCVVWMASITILFLLLDFCLDLLFLCGPSSVKRRGHDGSQMLPGSWEQDIQPAVPPVWLVRSQGKSRFKGMEKVTWQEEPIHKHSIPVWLFCELSPSWLHFRYGFHPQISCVERLVQLCGSGGVMGVSIR